MHDINVYANDGSFHDPGLLCFAAVKPLSFQQLACRRRAELLHPWRPGHQDLVPAEVPCGAHCIPWVELNLFNLYLTKKKTFKPLYLSLDNEEKDIRDLIYIHIYIY